MIGHTQSGRSRMVASLRQGIYAFSAVYLVIVVGLGAQVLLRNAEAANREHENSIVKQEIATTRSEIDRASKINVSAAPTDLSAVGKLQGSLEKLAKAHGCAVTEFHASNEVAPYLTRFAKTTDVSGWAQVETQVSIEGPAQQVAKTYAGLLQEDIPFEFDSLDLMRDSVDSAGDATVVGHATLRVLIRTEKENG